MSSAGSSVNTALTEVLGTWLTSEWMRVTSAASSALASALSVDAAAVQVYTGMASPREVRDQPRCGSSALVGTTMTVGPSASSAALNSLASFSVVSTLAARQPKPVVREAISSPGRSRPGTSGVFSSSANDLRIAYAPLRSTTNTMGS